MLLPPIRWLWKGRLGLSGGPGGSPRPGVLLLSFSFHVAGTPAGVCVTLDTVYFLSAVLCPLSLSASLQIRSVTPSVSPSFFPFLNPKIVASYSNPDPSYLPPDLGISLLTRWVSSSLFVLRYVREYR